MAVLYNLVPFSLMILYSVLKQMIRIKSWACRLQNVAPTKLQRCLDAVCILGLKKEKKIVVRCPIISTCLVYR